MTPKELAKHLREGLLHGTNKFISEREHMPMVIAALEAYEPLGLVAGALHRQGIDPTTVKTNDREIDSGKRFEEDVFPPEGE